MDLFIHLPRHSSNSHLDIVSDLSTGAFVQCLKRFAARQGLPLKFLSDNGKTFKVDDRFLDVAFKDDSVQEYLSTRGIQWIFNVECAPCTVVYNLDMRSRYEL